MSKRALTILAMFYAMFSYSMNAGATMAESISKESLNCYNIDKGKKAYQDEGCCLCHDNAVMGAPKPGKKETWTPIVSRGWDRILNQSINGNSGMPPKGGKGSLGNEEFKNIVAYMISMSI